MNSVKDSLLNVFGGCNNPHCICTINQPFEDYNTTVLYVFDDDSGTSSQPVKVVTNEHPFQLTINNPSNNIITVGKLDKCLFTDAVSKCDCLVTDNNQLFFVEIKNASSGSRGARRTKAARQLRLTIQTLKDNRFELENYKATALICFKSEEPRITQASRNSAFALFRDEMGIRLEEGNVIDFD